MVSIYRFRRKWEQIVHILHIPPILLGLLLRSSSLSLLITDRYTTAAQDDFDVQMVLRIHLNDRNIVAAVVMNLDGVCVAFEAKRGFSHHILLPRKAMLLPYFQRYTDESNIKILVLLNVLIGFAQQKEYLSD